MLIRCHIYGKKNCEGPEGWESNDNAPWYDPKGTYGDEIKGALANGYSVEVSPLARVPVAVAAAAAVVAV